MIFLDDVFERIRRETAVRVDDEEKRRRQCAGMRTGVFPAQADVLDDPALRQVLLTPGRAGKTTVTGRDLAITALSTTRGNIAYTTLDKKVARRYLWGELQALDHDFQLGLDFKSSDDLIVSPTGSIIYFGGTETIDACEKYRGTPWDFFDIDEAKSVPLRNMEALLTDILPPRLRDRRGRLRVQGTPGEALAGEFWRISDFPARRIVDGRARARPYRERNDPRWKGVAWEWSLHHWPLSENTAVHFDDCPRGCKAPHLWLMALEEQRQKGRADDHPSHRRENLGEWAADATGKCYAFEHGRNTWRRGSDVYPFGLPRGHDWYFTMGVDFGTTDPFAVVTWAYAADYPDLLQVDEFRAAGLSIRKQAGILRRKYDALQGRCVAMAGDPARKAVMLELRDEYQIPIEPAEKLDKEGAMAVMRGDLLEGRVKAFEGAEIIGEWQTLVLDPLTRREVEGMPADVSDAGLYGYRRALHRFATDAPAGPPRRGTPEWERQREEDEVARAVAEDRRITQVDEDVYDARVEDVGWFSEEDEW
jgi:hypothetical protein